MPQRRRRRQPAPHRRLKAMTCPSQQPLQPRPTLHASSKSACVQKGCIGRKQPRRRHRRCLLVVPLLVWQLGWGAAWVLCPPLSPLHLRQPQPPPPPPQVLLRLHHRQRLASQHASYVAGPVVLDCANTHTRLVLSRARFLTYSYAAASLLPWTCCASMSSSPSFIGCVLLCCVCVHHLRLTTNGCLTTGQRCESRCGCSCTGAK